MPTDPDKKLVRVRGGLKGFRIIELGIWKQEQLEKKNKLELPKILSQGERKQQVKRKRNQKRKPK